MLHVYGMPSLHLNLLLEINTYRVYYPKNTSNVFTNSDEVYYSVTCTDERRSARDRYLHRGVRTRLRWVCRLRVECEGTYMQGHWRAI